MATKTQPSQTSGVFEQLSRYLVRRGLMEPLTRGPDVTCRFKEMPMLHVSVT